MSSEDELRTLLRTRAAGAPDAELVHNGIRDAVHTVHQHRRRRQQVAMGLGVAVVAGGLGVAVPYLAHEHRTQGGTSITPGTPGPITPRQASTAAPATASAEANEPDHIQDNIAISFLSRYGDSAYDHAAKLASAWHTASVYDAKALAGQLINDGIDVTFTSDGSVTPSVADLTSAQKAASTFFEHQSMADAQRLATSWNSDPGTAAIVAGQAILDGHPYSIPG
jgi:hypothetical protein